MDNTLPFRITVCGIDELAGHCEMAVSHVLSILDPGWPVPEAFGAFGEHARLELRFHDVIDESGDGVIPPGSEHVAEVLAFGRSLLAEPAMQAHLLVHCHAGVSRSTASMALVMAQALPDVRADQILAHLLDIRPQAWPNLRIIEIGDAQLDRRGELIAATAGLYRTQLGKRPGLADEMSLNGRAREVEAAIG